MVEGAGRKVCEVAHDSAGKIGFFTGSFEALRRTVALHIWSGQLELWYKDLFGGRLFSVCNSLGAVLTKALQVKLGH